MIHTNHAKEILAHFFSLHAERVEAKSPWIDHVCHFHWLPPPDTTRGHADGHCLSSTPVELCMDWPAGTGPELYRYTLFCFMCGWCSINPGSTLVFQFTTQLPKPSLIPLHESHWELLPHVCAMLGSRVRLYFAVFGPSVSWRNFYYVHTHTI